MITMKQKNASIAFLPFSLYFSPVQTGVQLKKQATLFQKLWTRIHHCPLYGRTVYYYILKPSVPKTEQLSFLFMGDPEAITDIFLIVKISPKTDIGLYFMIREDLGYHNVFLKIHIPLLVQGLWTQCMMN